MTDPHEVYYVRTPPDTLTVVPQDKIEYVYEMVKGHDVLGVLFTDKRLGTFIMCLSTSAATHVVNHLATMLTNLDPLRAEWLERNGGAPA